jgi:hypothetical protein
LWCSEMWWRTIFVLVANYVALVDVERFVAFISVVMLQLEPVYLVGRPSVCRGNCICAVCLCDSISVLSDKAGQLESLQVVQTVQHNVYIHISTVRFKICAARELNRVVLPADLFFNTCPFANGKWTTFDTPY